jgi:phosphatidylethanolamine/phosphatidyl-N-methylethanolamine N-methyltransferase
MNNSNNKKIYKRWAGIYDKFLGSKYINKQRELEISMLNFRRGDSVLFIGIGTGEDLKYIPEGVCVTGIDITEEMLNVARKKAENLDIKNLTILNMDGQNLEFNNNEFDYVVLNLILSVIPDGHKCLSEAHRVLKKDGKIAIFDKFLEDKSKANLLRKLLNKITTSLGTDINRQFIDILGNIKLRIVEEQRSILGGMYRIIILKK